MSYEGSKSKNVVSEQCAKNLLSFTLNTNILQPTRSKFVIFLPHILIEYKILWLDMEKKH